MIIEIGKIQLIYTEADKQRAEQILAFLEEKLAGGKKPPQKAAVILLSDAATEDKEGWQEPIARLPDEVRRIPVGRTENADFSKKVPAKIREINYIRADDLMLENILDSVMIDSDFYRMRSEILLQMESWEASGRSDSFLMTKKGKIRKYRRMTADKSMTETDPRFKAQLGEMEEYLALSDKHARKIFFYSLRRGAAIALTAALFVFFVIAARYLIKTMRRANNEMALLGAPRSEDNAAENVILLCDGIINPTIKLNIRYAFVKELLSYLDLNWCTTPIGYNYKHRLTDARILDNERYLATTASNGKLLTWDTYTGRIKDELENFSNVPVKVFHVDMDSNITVIVTEENKVLFGIGSEWISNGSALPFTGNSKIRVETNSDHALVYDDQNLFYYEWSQEGDKVKPVSYFADEIIDKPYTISSAALLENGFLTAMRYGETLCLLQSDASDYDTEIVPSETCDTAIRGNRLVFADKEGNILLFEKESVAVEPVGLRLPDPRILCFVNDTTIAYFDGLLGTHLYDIEQHIDLGELFSSFDELTELDTTETSAVCFADGTYICQSIETLLPQREIEPSASLVCDSDAAYGEGQVRSVTPDGSGAVAVKLLMNGEEKEISLACSGKATATGIIDNGHGIVIGTEDGSFTEIVFRDSGDQIPCTKIRVPSHAAIRSVWETQDCYWILDEAGNYWWARLGYAGTEDSNVMFEQIEGKLHRGVTKELMDSISKETIESLNITMMPGGDGKEWE